MVSLHKELFVNLLEAKLETKEDIKFDSFFMLVEEYLNLEKDIENASTETIKLLHRAREDYLKDILFEISNSPFLKYSNFYSGDLKTILKIIKEDKVDYDLLKIVFSTFHKKRTINYFSNIQEILERNQRIDFGDIFILVDNLLQEIIYHNFSYERIKSILKYSTDKNNICAEIQKAFDEKDSRKYPFCLINVQVPEELEDKDLLIINNVRLYKIFNKEWKLSSSINAQMYKEHLESYFFTQNNRSKFKFNGNFYLFETQSLEGTDYQTKIRKFVRILESNLKGLLSKTGMRKKSVVHNTAFTFIADSPANFRLFNIAVANPKYISIHKNRSSRDIEEFFNQYRLSFCQENLKADSFRTIYNLIDLIENASEMTLENKLVIMWSCLEKICVDLNLKAVIQKVIQITTKSYLMYVLKQDLNEIWQEIVHYKYNETITSLNDVGIMQDDGFVKYNPEKLFITLKEMNREEQNVIMEKNIILAAKIHVFQENMKNSEAIKNYLRLEKSRVEQNIRRIYRHRNILVHTHNQESFDIEYFVNHLEKYLNGLLSTIIHYTLRNPSLTIKDIIYSIDQTYNYYESNIVGSNEYKSILKPHYLLL